MRSPRNNLIVLLVFTALLFGGVVSAQAQYSGRVTVYNPGNYDRTRTVMSNRAAMRRVIRKMKRRHAARRHRHTH